MRELKKGQVWTTPNGSRPRKLLILEVQPKLVLYTIDGEETNRGGRLDIERVLWGSWTYVSGPPQRQLPEWF